MRDPAYGPRRDVYINNPNSPDYAPRWREREDGSRVAYMRDPAYAQRRPIYEEPGYMRYQTESARDNMRDPAYAQGPDVYINNPDFVQYWLKKSFDENWTASDAK
jgi:hypothetical protein